MRLKDITIGSTVAQSSTPNTLGKVVKVGVRGMVPSRYSFRGTPSTKADYVLVQWPSGSQSTIRANQLISGEQAAEIIEAGRRQEAHRAVVRDRNREVAGRLMKALRSKVVRNSVFIDETSSPGMLRVTLSVQDIETLAELIEKSSPVEG